ncbi:MAG TPA: hypothetical protein GXX26_06440 [Clostridiaceae bacterium]|nr:hypothetical protein [Clostridiaceae bacterium]
MRSNLETYKIWAPDDAIWTQWAKPVLFIRQPDSINKVELNIPEIKWIQSLERNTMIIVDLPRHSGVEESLGLARLGYRPVPLYNGVDGPSLSTIVKVHDIVKALYKGADELVSCNIRADAPPVFMLDSNRMSGSGKQPGKYDNRWCVFPQDMPSASFIINQGINRIIVRSESIQNDLSHILCRYQKEGVDIYHCNGQTVRKIHVTQPSDFKSLSYRFRAIFGLTRNATGGFGSKIPEATQSSSSGVRYYGFG